MGDRDVMNEIREEIEKKTKEGRISDWIIIGEG